MVEPRPLSSRLIDVAVGSVSLAARLHPWAWSGPEGRLVRDVRYAPGAGRDHLLDVHIPPRPGPRPVALYIHGGGFRILSKETHWMMVEQLVRAGFVVFNVNYRLAPVHPYPAAVEDAAAALRFVHEVAPRYGADPEQLVLAGESAGANLATALAVATSYRRGEAWAEALFASGIRPRAVLALCGLFEVRNDERFERQPIPAWQRDRIRIVCRGYLPPDARARAPGSDLADPLSILERGEPPERPLPPFSISVGTADPIAEDSERLDQALEKLGVPRELSVFPGEIHAFQAVFWRPAARASWRRAVAFAQRHLGGEDRGP